MKGDAVPNSKLPITPLMINSITAMINTEDILAVRDMTMYVLMFYGFIRFSECHVFEQTVIQFEKDHQLKITIRNSKTDQTGVGASVYISPRETNYCACKWYRRYSQIIHDNGIDFSFEMTPTTFQKRLKFYLQKIPIDEAIKKYSSHSFRKGGANTAALNGVQDSHIKVHGRWKSHIYTKYTSVQMIEAGSTVTMAI